MAGIAERVAAGTGYSRKGVASEPTNRLRGKFPTQTSPRRTLGTGTPAPSRLGTRKGPAVTGLQKIGELRDQVRQRNGMQGALKDLAAAFPGTVRRPGQNDSPFWKKWNNKQDKLMAAKRAATPIRRT